MFAIVRATSQSLNRSIFVSLVLNHQVVCEQHRNHQCHEPNALLYRFDSTATPNTIQLIAKQNH